MFEFRVRDGIFYIMYLIRLRAVPNLIGNWFCDDLQKFTIIEVSIKNTIFSISVMLFLIEAMYFICKNRL